MTLHMCHALVETAMAGLIIVSHILYPVKGDLSTASRRTVRAFRSEINYGCAYQRHYDNQDCDLLFHAL